MKTIHREQRLLDIMIGNLNNLIEARNTLIYSFEKCQKTGIKETYTPEACGN